MEVISTAPVALLTALAMMPVRVHAQRLQPGIVTTTVTESLVPSIGKARGPVWEPAAVMLDELRRRGKAFLVHPSPEVYAVPGFLSDQECDVLAAEHYQRVEAHDDANDHWCFAHHMPEYGLSMHKWDRLVDEGKAFAGQNNGAARCVNAKLGKAIKANFTRKIPHSTSTMHWLGEKPLIDHAIHKAKHTLGLDPAVAMYMQLLRYETGDAYEAHTDCHATQAVHGMREATLLVYLTDADSDGLVGGETVFTQLGLSIKPQKGMAVVFESLANVSQKCDPKSEHKANPVHNGTKLVWQQWFYQAQVPIGIDSWTTHFDGSLSSRTYLWQPGVKHALQRLDDITHRLIRRADQCDSPECVLANMTMATRMLRHLMIDHPRLPRACARLAESLVKQHLLIAKNESAQRHVNDEVEALLRCAVNDLSNPFDGIELRMELSSHIANAQGRVDGEVRALLEDVVRLGNLPRDASFRRPELVDKAREILQKEFGVVIPRDM